MVRLPQCRRAPEREAPTSRPGRTAPWLDSTGHFTRRRRPGFPRASGNESRRFAPHSAAVNGVSIDVSGERVGSCSQVGG
eukprot:scaffold9029_cov108-Isochrysis_galbana.AAC.2